MDEHTEAPAEALSPHVYVVRAPFGDYVQGDVVEDKDVHPEQMAHLVRIARPEKKES